MIEETDSQDDDDDDNDDDKFEEFSSELGHS